MVKQFYIARKNVRVSIHRARAENRAFRDPSYSAILREYSGAPLIPGQTINLMQVLSAYNKAQDYTPYERFMNAIYNGLNPAVQTPQPAPPPPPKHHHESFWDELIGAIVAVVVMIVAPEAAASVFFGAATLSAGEMAVSFAVAGALASAATQGVAIAFDDQHGFSVSSMLENAVASGATAGLSKALGIQQLLQEDHYLPAFAESVALGATVQAFQLAAGLRNQFDLKLIIEQAAGTVLQAKTNSGLTKESNHVVNFVNAIENTSVNVAFGEKIDVTTLAGTYLGDEAGDSADLIARHMIQSHHTTSIGKTSRPTHFDDHARSHHTDSHYTPDTAQQDDSIGDLYDAYKSGLHRDVNAMAAAQFDSALASDAQHADLHHAMQQNHHDDSDFVNWVSHEVYDHQRSWWARGIMNFAAVTNSNAMHLVLHATNTFTRDLMGDVAGSYGTRYFDDLQNGRSTFSDAMNFVGAELDVQALGEVGGVVLGYTAQFADEVLPSVSRNLQSLFGSSRAERLSQSALRSQVLSNIAKSSAAREATAFPVLSAKIDQMSGGYLPDAWEMTTLRKGDFVYGGLPGASPYFTDENAIVDSLGDRNILYKNLQVRLNLERGAYRPNIGVYQLLDDVRVPAGIINANPAFGPGGEVQYFIGAGASGKLTLLNEIELKEFYEQTLSTHRPSY